MRTSSREQVFSPHPLALLLAALTAGILLAHFCSISLAWSLSLTASASLLTVGLLLKRRHSWSTLSVVLAVFFAGAAMDTIASRTPPNQIKRLMAEGRIAAGEPVEIAGVLDRPLEYTPDGFYLTLRVEKLRSENLDHVVTGVVQVFAPVRDDHASSVFDSLHLYYGARVRVLTALERADNYRNPGVSSRSEFLDRNGYDATGKLKSPMLVERLDDAPVFAPLRSLYDWRRRLELEIAQHFSAETAGVLDAAFLGNRYFLSRAAAEKFREGGTFHVLVISGLHISFIGGMVFLIARRLTKSRCVQFVASAAVLWAYTLAVGAESSVVRSALMFTLVVLAPLVARQANSLNALGGAGLLQLLWRPDEVFDPSFQLTFLSVLAIIVIAIPLLRKLALIGEWQPTRESPYPPACPAWLRSYCESLYWSERRWRSEMANANYSYRLNKAPLAVSLERYRIQPLLRYAASAFVVSGSVQVGLLPLFIIYFHRLSLASLFLNVAVSVLMAVLGFAALAALALAQASSLLAAPLFAFVEAVNWTMVHSVDLFERLGIPSLRLPEYSGWLAMLYALNYVPLIILVWRLARWNPLTPPRLERDDCLVSSPGPPRYSNWLSSDSSSVIL